jgi:two-component system, OmpR family, sensor histidine kinase CreC
MKLGLRLLLGFFLITGIAAFFVLRVFAAEIRPSVARVVEDMLVDTANILAELVEDDLAAMPAGGTLETGHFAQRVREYAERPVDARIWGMSKQSLDYRVYVTDARGRVVLDTGARPGGVAIGQDYSRWRDVALTLKGQYGARATRQVEVDGQPSVLYVAAPIRQGARLIGVLTVAKPMSTVQKFIDRAEREILVKGLWLLGLSLLVGVLVTAWIVWSVRRLRDFAQHVELGQRGGERVQAPELSGELGDLARAMEAMRDRLEDHEHVEHMVRALTHELKSPLAAIGGAAELLHDDLPAHDRHAFATQVQDQAARMQRLVERLLELSKLEHRRRLEHLAVVDLAPCVETALAQARGRAEQRGVSLQWQQREQAAVLGEPELMHLAMSNLLDNAIDFSWPGGRIEVSVRREGAQALFTVRDHGPGVPDYALARLGERFYSTPRPAVAGEPPRKGTGLGLAIVRQVMQLHGGDVVWAPAGPGLAVTLRWPLATPSGPST